MLPDHYADSNTKFCIIAYLNDNYEGGEILISDKNLSLKPKAATVLIIPFEELVNYKVADFDGLRYICSVVVEKIQEGDNHD